MANVLKKALRLITGTPAQVSYLKPPKKLFLRARTERELIQLESEIGRELFGPVPEGHRREFFNLDPQTWIWHEEIKQDDGQTRAITTRYELQDTGILKVQDGSHYTYLEGQELTNLVDAIKLYYEKVARTVYGRDPHTGVKLS